MKLIRKTGLKDIFNEGRRRQCGLFRCPLCGGEVERSLANGKKTNTCGTHTHNGSGTNLYYVWGSMKQRCLNYKNKKYRRYGKRGVSICVDWMEFEPFQKWAVENGYKNGLQIDRIDNDGNYEPSNCRWVTAKENSRNSSKTKLTAKDVKIIRELINQGDYMQKEIAEIFNVTPANIVSIKYFKIWKN